jgi:hypothetical protein
MGPLSQLKASQRLAAAVASLPGSTNYNLRRDLQDAVKRLEAYEADHDAEERRAWDEYAAGIAASNAGTHSLATMAGWADGLLEERRKRFPVKP